MKTKRQNFTLIEMLIVLIIALILAGMILAANAKIQQMAEISKATAQIAKIESALESYFNDHGEYPDNTAFRAGDLSLDELNMLRDPNGKLYVNWEVDEDMTDAKDPWGQNYVLNIPGTMNKGSYDIICKGQDEEYGAGGGTNISNAHNFDDNDDITNWKN